MSVFLLTGQLVAATPVPNIYCDYTFQVAGRRVGILETDRVIRSTHQRIIVPGRQTIIDFGVYSLVLPMSLVQLVVVALAVVGFLWMMIMRWKKDRLAHAHNEPK